jgi:prevent-host-death family protein
MTKVNIHEAKTHLSKYLARVKRGETIILCSRNEPIAELRPVKQRRTKRRPIGLADGEFTIPKEFFDPLPDEIINAFYGESGEDSN